MQRNAVRLKYLEFFFLFHFSLLLQTKIYEAKSALLADIFKNSNFFQFAFQQEKIKKYTSKT